MLILVDYMVHLAMPKHWVAANIFIYFKVNNNSIKHITQY